MLTRLPAGNPARPSATDTGSATISVVVGLPLLATLPRCHLGPPCTVPTYTSYPAGVGPLGGVMVTDTPCPPEAAYELSAPGAVMAPARWIPACRATTWNQYVTPAANVPACPKSAVAHAGPTAGGTVFVPTAAVLFRPNASAHQNGHSSNFTSTAIAPVASINPRYTR